METSHTNVPLVVVAAEARFYFRQELLIEYDRKKMRVWGRWCLQILPNNWEDASDQPVSPSCACYLISYIFLINFSGIKVCGGGVSSTLHLQWRGTVWNSNVIAWMQIWIWGGEKERKKKKIMKLFMLFHIVLRVTLTYLQLLYQFYAFLLSLHRWIYLRKRYLITLRKTMERKHEMKIHHLHGSIKPLKLTTF